MKRHWLCLTLVVVGFVAYFALKYLWQGEMSLSLIFLFIPLVLLLVAGGIFIIRWGYRR